MVIIDDAALARYRQDGFLLVKSLFSPEEVQVMLEQIESPKIKGLTWDAVDRAGKSAPMALWTDIADDVWGAASSNPRIVNTIRILQGEDIAFFHGKVMLKTAGTGGKFDWHQDFGYWYNQGFVFPRMMSAFVALDPCMRANGCLEVRRGSHRLGRLDHGSNGGQMGADLKRLEEIAPFCEHLHVEMEPGSALFFDCNLLHGSGPNDSAMHRRSFVICFNALANPCVLPNHDLLKVSCPVSADNAILGYATASA